MAIFHQSTNRSIYLTLPHQNECRGSSAGITGVSVGRGLTVGDEVCGARVAVVGMRVGETVGAVGERVGESDGDAVGGLTGFNVISVAQENISELM